MPLLGSVRRAARIAIAGGAVLPLALRAQAPDSVRIVAGADRVITAATPASASPGCAVGIARDGRPVYARAFGMADLEFGIPNTPETIFESGSVAKQFTAASIVLLALDGKLRLDDPVKKYITELPDYGAPLTIRHLLNHTGGVRDWGSVLELTGFGRGDRVVTQTLALDVIVHQRALDFTPGAEYSYSNSGYTLLSTIVERVSKQSLPAFTAERFFKPLGMTHTTWREDYRRLVPGRAQAYASAGNGTWRLEMPFMNVYGNGGMLTTVGDWLKWNTMLGTRSLGAALVDSMERRGVLNNGHPIAYALGLTHGLYKFNREIAHSGSTAGYQTYLTRFPDLGLSIAVLCNSATPNATLLAHNIVDAISGPFRAAPAPDTVSMSTAELQKRAATWREVDMHLPAQTIIENGTLRVVGGAALHPLRDGSFLAAPGPVRWQFEIGADGKPAKATRIAADDERHYVAATAWTPTTAQLAEFAGVWHSDEADATFTVAIDGSQIALVQRPATRIVLRPLYKDHFAPAQGAGQVMWFTRDAAGRVTTLHIGASRMRDMPFVRATR
jgi:CubicO group peptidase (beta-lactamase class C family)